MDVMTHVNTLIDTILTFLVCPGIPLLAFYILMRIDMDSGANEDQL